jgi:hypothetical protein
MSDIKLFRIGQASVTELPTQSPQVEKSLQNLFETNLEALLGVRFLASEFSTGPVHGGRIDTLGIDEDGSPVIIEYKRSVNENVINQGLFYLDWLMDHKKDFLWLVMDKLGKESADKVEWGAPRLICIAGDFNHPAGLSTAGPLPKPASPLTATNKLSAERIGDILSLQDLGSDRLSLAKIALRHCLLPDTKTVASFGGAVFPSIRDQKNRLTVGESDGRRVLLDDNVTPRWALLWAHGIAATHHLRGWTFAHVWGASKDPEAYTHLANLCMMPEFFGSLSDKQGPLCAYLRYHAWAVYGWRYGDTIPSAPEGYDTLEWRYLPAIEDPVAFVRTRVATLNNQRVELLRSIV